MFSEGSSDPSPPDNDNGEGQGGDHKHNHDNDTKQTQGKLRDGRMTGGQPRETQKVHVGSKTHAPKNKQSQAFGAHQDDKRHRERMAEDKVLQQQRQLQRSAEGQELYT